MLRPLLCLLVAIPVFAANQPSREILELQREVADLQEQIKVLTKAHEAGIARLEALAQQAVDAANKAGAAAASVNGTVQEKSKEISVPVIATKSEVGQIANDVRTLQQAVTDLAGMMTRMQTQVTDVANLVKVMQTPTQPPPMSAADLFNNANRDMTGGKPDLALNEFGEFLKNYGDTDQAPDAQYYVGRIYYDNKEYDNALKAFDAVLENWPKSMKAPDALYYKAASLARTGRRTAALAAQRELQRNYPNHEYARKPLPTGR